MISTCMSSTARSIDPSGFLTGPLLLATFRQVKNNLNIKVGKPIKGCRKLNLRQLIFEISLEPLAKVKVLSSLILFYICN